MKVKLSKAVQDLLTSERTLAQLNRAELLAIVEDDGCPEFLQVAIAEEFRLRLASTGNIGR